MKKFLKNTSGNIALMTGIVAIPLFAAAGGILDYSVIYNKRSGTQNGLDAAILYAGTQMSRLTDAELKKNFSDSLQSNLTTEQISRITKTEFTIDRTNGSMHVSIKSGYPTSLLKIVGISEINYEINSQIQIGSRGGAEIILALDTTKSMEIDNKIGALKTAATNFATEMLANNAVTDKVKIGIVPFERYVNVGTQHRNAKWIDVGNDSTEEICKNESQVISKSGCVTRDRIVDGVISGTYEQCSSIVRAPEQQICSSVSTSWHGCVGSRDEPLNIQDGSYNTRIPGLMNVSCATPILPLTARKSNILDAISDLNPSGETYMAAGMAWSLRAISAGEPFGEGVSFAKAKQDNTKKFIVLMSDGENTLAPSEDNFERHEDNDVDRANNYTLQACNEAKSNNITIYTIGFGEEITPDTQALLKECASTTENYISANSGRQLQLAFNKISAEVNAVFLSR